MSNLFIISPYAAPGVPAPYLCSIVENRDIVDEIQGYACWVFGISKEEMLYGKKVTVVADCRRASMAVARRLFPFKPLKQIAAAHNVSNHTTVRAAVKTSEDLCETDENYRNKYNAILSHFI